MSEHRLPTPPPPPPPMLGWDMNCALGGYNVCWARWQMVRGAGLWSCLRWLLFMGNVSDAEHRKIEHIERQAAEVCHYWDGAEYHYHEAGKVCR